MELFCPGEFIRNTPQGIVGEWRNLYEGEQQQNVENIRVPILKLAHVTHNAEAHQITTDHSCQFRAAPKYGRPGRPGTGSYRWTPINDFVPIDENTNLFQGNYSWWSPYAHEYDLPPNHPHREYCESPAQIAGSLPQGDYYVANYLKHPSESFYGNRVFHANFSDLLDAYTKSRYSQEVFIKIGGTLRYIGEICFVLIVCTEHDDLDFPALRTNDDFLETNGLINDDGRVIDRNAIANFHPRHIIHWAREDCNPSQSYSYITAAFAFYYPGMLAVDRRNVCGPAESLHTDRFCLKKKIGKCPNNIVMNIFR